MRLNDIYALRIIYEGHTYEADGFSFRGLIPRKVEDYIGGYPMKLYNHKLKTDAASIMSLRVLMAATKNALTGLTL